MAEEIKRPKLVLVAADVAGGKVKAEALNESISSADSTASTAITEATGVEQVVAASVLAGDDWNVYYWRRRLHFVVFNSASNLPTRALLKSYVVSTNLDSCLQ